MMPDDYCLLWVLIMWEMAREVGDFFPALSSK
jgi:hypothetical protein